MDTVVALALGPLTKVDSYGDRKNHRFCASQLCVDQ